MKILKSDFNRVFGKENMQIRGMVRTSLPDVIKNIPGASRAVGLCLTKQIQDWEKEQEALDA